MKNNLLIRLFAIASSVPFLTSCGEDSDPVAVVTPDKPSVALSLVEFIPVNATIKENSSEGYLFQLQLSNSLVDEGNIIIQANSSSAEYGQDFITEPAFTNGALNLPVAADASVISFKVIPIDNAIITGEKEIEFNISETSANIKKGTKLKEAFKISDDELSNMPRGYEIAAGSWGLKETREYDVMGRISKAHIESATPEKSTRTKTYYYDAAGRLEKINLYPGVDEIYVWENNRIIKSEEIQNGVVKSYVEYAYDAFGNISETANYFLQPNGQFSMGFQFAYLYFTDGNLYKSFSYAPSQNGEEPTLLETRTYDGYIAHANPFPMVSILPTVQTQAKLPSVYRLERDGVELVYELTYEFGDGGLLEKRTASGAQGSEVAVYSYY